MGVLELILHRSRLARIPIRIHVNGTRGKTSVTRLIAAGLREAGVRCVAKTTGTVPRFILPNGREVPVYRPGGANVIEQKQAVTMAAAQRAEALVVECMALQPSLQWLSESKLVRATHGAITNARPDHLDVMGPAEEDVAHALAGTVPVDGVFLTAERKHRAFFQQVAEERGSRFRAAEDISRPLTTEDVAGFPYLEHQDNVELALAVCEEIGIDNETALRGMWRAKPDPGAMTETRVEFFGRHVIFVNGFAANDPISTRYIWEQSLRRHRGLKRRIAVFNCRSDRADRSEQLAESYAGWTQADEVVLLGTGQYIFARAAVRSGLDPTRLVFVDRDHPADIFEILLGLSESSALVMGLGNIAGPGLALAEYFANRGMDHARD
ncbi:MAG: poly-gamma-glutamate synthase PgsB [Deltaproteobacteria bacterium]|nr:poly-gamma-glutamate synthase PgsB [Deltaproteobacteria bacterium]MBW2160536.1 poly-gamma-glutamate synthase PgsB [Deltaproteobacteria bacterium]MBW2587270.1 poly-gamma-glutamate synthase PgsB [Deltaproteobacteria bacterium]